MPFRSLWEEELCGPTSIYGPRDWDMTPEKKRTDCWQEEEGKENVPYSGFQDKTLGGSRYSETKAEVQFTQTFIKM